MSIEVKCIFKGTGKLPKYETIGAVGMDLRANEYALPSNLKETFEFGKEGFVLKPFQRVLVKTGLFVELPENTEIQIRPRSGLALKSGITVLNSPGTIDEDYRGDIGVILFNTSDKPFVIQAGDRIAQAVFNNVEKAELIETEELNKTLRGEDGYNSTGTK